MSKTVLVDGHRYYFSLKKTETNNRSLLGDYENKTYDLYSGIVVCRNFRGKDSKGLRTFAVFKHHIDLYKHMVKVPQPVKSFFEVIFGHRSQKPHFDIDVDLTTTKVDGEQLLKEIVLASMKTLKDKGVNIDPTKDLLIYTSSDATKISYHIIIDHWMHANNTEASNFCVNVRNNLREEYRPYIDPKVYNPLQQFRILWSNKIDSSRVKVPLKQLKLDDLTTYVYPTFELETDELLASLISNTAGCQILPVFIDTDSTFYIDNDGTLHNYEGSNTYVERETKLTKNDAQLMLDLLSRKMGFAPNSLAIRSYFTIRECTNGIVSLTKKQRYKCIICHRCHDNENPFLSVSANGTVRYHCRRADDSTVLGSLDHLAVEEEEKEEEEVIIPTFKKPLQICAALSKYVKPKNIETQIINKEDELFLASCYAIK
jgi:hypothetical protein